MAKWKTSGSPGVRYREHTTRKHGVRFDRYFSIRYRVDGKQVEEGLGWASEGWTEKKAAATLAELKANKTTGTGPLSLREKRQMEKERREAEAKRQEAEKLANITFAEVFTAHYLPVSQMNKRSEKSWQREEQLFRNWISPHIGHIPMRSIAPIHLEKIKKAMKEAGRAPRSIQYMLDTIRQVFNHAITNSLHPGPNPAAGRAVKRPKEDNRRTRFLTSDEASILLAELSKRSADTYDMALFSLHTGARAGEIFSLTWGDIDIFSGTALLRDTKNNKNRHLYLTDQVKKMLLLRKPGTPSKSDLVFPAGKGNMLTQVSKTYYRVVEQLGLNEGVTDRRDKVTFHTLRHTYASTLVQKGVDIYHVKELLGHASIALTERYSHLSENSLKQAALKIQGD